MAKTAFVSYASEDEAVAGRISTYLEQSGVTCWIAPRDVRPGAEYASEIIDGIETSAVFVLVLSEHANTSEFVKREVERAVSKGKPVFPVRVREVVPSKSLELFISSAEWIDAWQPPIERYLDRLAVSIRAAAAVYSDGGRRPAGIQAAPGQTTIQSAETSPAPGGRSGGVPRPIMALLGVGAFLLAVMLAWGLFRLTSPSAPATASGGGPTGADPSTARPGPGSSVPGAAPAATAGSAAPAESAPAPAAASTDANVAGLLPTDPCPRSLSVNRSLPTPFTCTCSAQATSESAVWGTDFYTDDSGLCRAALHAGVISSQGGQISVLRTPGRPLYVGSKRYGVQTNDFAAYQTTIEFKGTPPPPPGPGLCPQSMTVTRELPVPFTCRCSADASQSGAVWGTDVYTEDSGMCRAAVHAGKITPTGGTITVMRADGRPLYIGSTRNGVYSNDFGADRASITFR